MLLVVVHSCAKGIKMLIELHRLIEKVCPIIGISQNGNNEFLIDYHEHATQEQKQAAQEIIQQWPIIRAKEIKLQEIENQWQTKLQTGWDCGQGHLGLNAEDVALLAANFALAKESASLGGQIPPLITKENNIINFENIQDLTQMMLAYGQARSMLSIEFAEKRKAVEKATTIQELEAIL